MSSPTTFQINGRSVSVLGPGSIIETADQLGIYIPRFCYHKKLSVVANCRMCLVEVQGLPKPVPACSTPIAPNMNIFTRSAKVKAAQQAVMEFLLINHPLDCPICDQGGQCELQDLAMQYGRDRSDFAESKRVVPNDDLGSLIATEMTRCIQCTRCVRFGSEVAGKMELGAVGRGENMQITTYVKQPLQSELSGNMIDVCPVGALTSKPFRFKARAWELRSIPSIAPHDCLGSHVYLHTQDQQVMRVVPRENEEINEVWLSDRDRYSYLGVTSHERLQQPMVKRNGAWHSLDWSSALYEAAASLKKALAHDKTQLGGVISPSATLEEMYLFQWLCRGLGSSNIDHRLHEVDMADQHDLPRTPYSEISIRDLEQCEVVLLVGANIQREQPLLITRLRKLVAKGGCVMSINCVDYNFSFEIAHKRIIPPDQLAQQIDLLVEYLKRNDLDAVDIKGTQPLMSIAKRLSTAKRAAILVGAVARNHPQASDIRYGVSQLTKMTGACAMHLTEGANSTGAWIAGAVPHRLAGGAPLLANAQGMALQSMIQKRLKAYLLFGIEPTRDCANPAQVQAALTQADCIIACSAFMTPDLLSNAQLLLPIHCFGENAGTFVNLEGKWQSFEAAIPSAGESRAGWQVLQALGNCLNIQGSDCPTVQAVCDTLKAKISSFQECPPPTNAHEAISPARLPINHRDEGDKLQLMRITEWPLYRGDSLVRQAPSLQQSGGCEAVGAYMHTVCANRFGLQPLQKIRLHQPEGISGWLPVIIENGIPDSCVWTPAGYAETSTLGDSFGPIAIEVMPKESMHE
jgi:NADH-quinone oxidoreductase subunit G